MVVHAPQSGGVRLQRGCVPIVFAPVDKQGNVSQRIHGIRLVAVNGCRVAVENLANPGGAGARRSEKKSQVFAVVHYRMFPVPSTVAANGCYRSIHISTDSTNRHGKLPALKFRCNSE